MAEILRYVLVDARDTEGDHEPPKNPERLL